MAENISLSIFGTFGNPHGFTQTIAGDIKGLKTYDLNPTAIQIFDSAEAVYSLKKEMVGNTPVISFIKYSYASEQGSTRGGTFIGASVISANGIADIDSVVSVLDKLHESLVSNPANIQDGVIMVKHSSEFKVSDIQVNNLKINPEAIADIDFSEKGKNLFVYTDLSNIQQTFKRALDLLNDYDIIYFAKDTQTAEYVAKKGLSEVVQEIGEIKQLTEKIKAVENAKLLKQKAVLDKLLKDIEIVNSDKTLFIKKYQKAIEKNKDVHRKNAEKITEAEQKLSQYSHSYDSQVLRLRQLSQKIEGKLLKQAERNQIENEIREIASSFEKEKRTFSEPVSLGSISELGGMSDTQKPFEDPNTDNDDGIHRRKRSLQGFSAKEIAIILGAVLLLGSLAYAGWYFFGDKKDNKEIVYSEDAIEDQTADSNESQDSLKININPFPNDFLIPTDTEKTIKKQFPDDKLPMPVDSVVTKIFKANPSEIGKIYKGQEKEYGEILIQKNPNNFDADKKLKNTLRMQIPIYKKDISGKSDSATIPMPENSSEVSTIDNLTQQKQTND